jgi:polyisoprenoid-binding protein YceI
MNKFARPLGAIVLFSLLSFTTIVETAVWKYDNDHAKLGFSISHMTVTDVDGSFKKAAEENTYTVTGNLTLHGVTKPVTLSALAKTAIHPLTKKTIAGFKITGKINRKDFGIAEQTPSAMLGEEVNILANAEFIKN